MEIKSLTKAEEEIMIWVWKLGKTNVNGIIEQLPEPKPAYNTVSTIVRILESKGFVGHEPKGRGYLYFPLIEEETYSHRTLQEVAENYFQNSFKNMVSFFVKKKDIDIEDVEYLLNEIKKEKDE